MSSAEAIKSQGELEIISPSNPMRDMDLTEFAHEYDLDRLNLIVPQKRDFSMWVTPRFHGHYVRSSYDDLTSDLVAAYAQGIGLFIDVGAHFGYYSLVVGKSNPACKIAAFEPVPQNYEVLKRNVEYNHLNAVLVNQAISNTKGLASFNISLASDNCGFIQHPTTPTLYQVQVETTTLRDVLNDNPEAPTLIKIDTEGHEIEVLEGAESALRDREDIRLVVEWSPICLRTAGRQPEELLEKLTEFNYDIFQIDERSRRLHRVRAGTGDQGLAPRLEPGCGYANLLCVKKTRSLNAVFFSHSSQLGGAERNLLEVVTQLAQDHAAICTVYLPSGGPLEGAMKKAGAVTIVGDYSWWCALETPSQPEIDQLFKRSFAWVLSHLPELRKIDPDVIYSNTMVIPWGAIVAALINRAHVWKVNEFGELDHGLKFFIPFTQVLSLIAASSNQVWTCSKAVQQMLLSSVGPMNAETVLTYISIPKQDQIHNGQEYFIQPGAIKLLILGAVGEPKGQGDAVAAAIELIKNRGRDVELLVVGNCNPKFCDALKKVVADAGVQDRIRFLTYQDNVFPVVHQADVVLVCSRMEAFGRTTLEAFLMRKPVVGTARGGTVELIREGETGLLYEPGDSRTLANQIERLIDHPELRSALAENAFQFATQTLTKESFGGRIYQRLTALKSEEGPPNNQIHRLIDHLFVSLMAETPPEREQMVRAYTAQTLAQEQIARTLATQLSAQTDTVNSLVAQVGERQQAVEALAKQLTEKEQALGHLNNILNGIYKSRWWQVGARLHSVYTRILSLGSVQRESD